MSSPLFWLHASCFLRVAQQLTKLFDNQAHEASRFNSSIQSSTSEDGPETLMPLHSINKVLRRGRDYF